MVHYWTSEPNTCLEGNPVLQQALRAGLTPGAVRARLQSGKWQRLHRGVYLTHSGPVGDDALAWAVLSAAGEGALLSHGSAQWVWGVGPVPAQWTVLVPHDRRRRVDGAVLVRTRDLPRVRSVNGYRTTSLPRAIVDVADRPGAAVDDVIALTAKVCQKMLTTPEILKELASRWGHRLRHPLRLILGDVTDGIESLAEHRFLHGVVRAHALQPFQTQVITSRIRADFANQEFAVSAEIDGLAFHAGGFRSDRRRDRKASARGILTVRATWWDVEDEPATLPRISPTRCEAAAGLAHRSRAPRRAP